MNGILLIDKPKNYTSRDIVNIVSKTLNTKKVGHTGTLDPLATGVLVLCIGKATKLVDLLTSSYKEYDAEMTFGIKTDTGDITGKVIKEDNKEIEEEEIIEALNNIKGTYNQTVPIYSAVKINGKKLYEYAREGLNVELPKRLVDIKEIELLEYNKKTVKFKTLVSKGTYIRSLIEDICSNLNTVGCMTNLRRTKQGDFNIKDCFTLDDISNNNFTIISIEEVLKDKFTIEVDDKLYNKVINGAVLDNNYNNDLIVFKKNDKILSVYKKYKDDKIKPYIMF